MLSTVRLRALIRANYRSRKYPHVGVMSRASVLPLVFFLSTNLSAAEKPKADSEPMLKWLTQNRVSYNPSLDLRNRCLEISDKSQDSNTLEASRVSNLSKDCFGVWMKSASIKHIDVHATGDAIAIAYNGSVLIQERKAKVLSRRVISGASTLVKNLNSLSINLEKEEVMALNSAEGRVAIWSLSADGFVAPKRYVSSEVFKMATALTFLEGLDLIAVAADRGYGLNIYRRLAHSASPKPENSTQPLETLNLSSIVGESVQITDLSWNRDLKQLIVYDASTSRIHILEKQLAASAGFRHVKSMDANAPRNTDVHISADLANNGIFLINDKSELAKLR